MAIRPEVNGKAVNASKVYASSQGKTQKVRRVYLERDGKTALYWTSAGTKDNPTIIRTKEDFLRIEEEPGGYYELGADIDLGEGMEPICTQVPFTGTLDGCRHNIFAKNTMKRKESAEGLVSGVFGINKGTIMHVLLSYPGMVGAEGTAFGDVKSGTLAAINYGIIQECCLSLNGFIGPGPSGGVVCDNHGILDNISMDMAMQREEGRAGGFAMYNYGKIDHSVVYTSYSQRWHSLFEDYGTLAYYLSGEIRNSYTVELNWIHPEFKRVAVVDGGTSSYTGLIAVDEATKQYRYTGLDFKNYWIIKPKASGPNLRYFVGDS